MSDDKQGLVARFLAALMAGNPYMTPHANPGAGSAVSPEGLVNQNPPSLEGAVPPPQMAPPPVTSASYGAPSLPTPPPTGLPTPPQAQPWMALGNQNRTAAFDPTRDANDPGNIRAVDQYGRVLPRSLMGPV